MPNLGPDYDVAVRLRALEDTVRRMQANPLAQAFSMTQSDGSVGMELGQDPITGSGRWIVYQGTTTSRDPNTSLHPFLLYVGELMAGGVLVDSGLIMFRPDGSQSMVVGNKGVQVLDAGNRTQVATDEDSGEGLALPWLPLPLPANTNITTWPATNNTAWTTVADNEFRAQQPKVWWVGQAFADSGTNGEVQLVITGPSGTVASGPVHPVTGGSFIGINDVLTLPAGFSGQGYSMVVQARATSGTGHVYCQTQAAYGRQT